MASEDSYPTSRPGPGETLPQHSSQHPHTLPTISLLTNSAEVYLGWVGGHSDNQTEYLFVKLDAFLKMRPKLIIL